MDESARMLRQIGSIKTYVFSHQQNETIFTSYSTVTGSESNTVGVASEKYCTGSQCNAVI